MKAVTIAHRASSVSDRCIHLHISELTELIVTAFKLEAGYSIECITDALTFDLLT